MSDFRDDVTHEPLVVSNKSTNVIRAALVTAHRAGDITDEEYAMTYAEVCELGRYPQAFGGGKVPDFHMERWQNSRSWA